MSLTHSRCCRKARPCNTIYQTIFFHHSPMTSSREARKYIPWIALKESDHSFGKCVIFRTTQRDVSDVSDNAVN